MIWAFLDMAMFIHQNVLFLVMSAAHSLRAHLLVSAGHRARVGSGRLLSDGFFTVYFRPCPNTPDGKMAASVGVETTKVC